MKYNNTSRNILLPLIIAFSVAAGLIVGVSLPGSRSNTTMSVKPRTDKLTNLLNIIDSKYVDTVNRAEIIEEAIPFILHNLDPHSVYIPARDLQAMNEPLQGNFEGIGVSFNKLSDTVLIISTIPGGPSEKVGVMAGDKIIYVNDSLIAGKGLADEEIISMLKGPRGTEVTIRVMRKGEDELLPFTIKRDRIPIYSVDVSYMVNDDVGYIKISRFAVTTYDEFVQGLVKLKSMGMKKLIIDLRGNSGGVMESAIKIADELLPEGKLIVYTVGRAYPREEAVSTASGHFTEGDLAILQDEFSASASEILAGAIQDNDRGIILGRRSFGKGLVQEPMVFSDGSALRLTIARYYTPTGRSIQKPYDNGFDEYYADMNERFARGEYENADSIKLNDSLKYVTPGGRVLYGGGGIMPDYFIPADTTGITRYYMRIRSSGLIYQFALQYTDSNLEMLKGFNDLDALVSYLNGISLLRKFTDFASEKGITATASDIEKSGNPIFIELKAYIARNIFDNDGFYPVWQELDTSLQKAIDIVDGL